ncbi:MAG: UDP-N-acetylglucosamine--N-acetylmuramyl-(pentapeptide) pyrophosphoryl-undecaprenol N-acetylglucosamine transferase [Alphaproteobacteria bacterium]|jgi:UDP-N-acetylglucosamine--N-acetylmuramyl-(pentapeptide) pyrophosphoryl-undecaprenol N-acetylglucosamine transferase
MNNNLLVIMAGGTGGHVFPGLAVANHMREKDWNIEWIGTADKMEAQLVPKHGFAIHFIKIGGLRGKSLITKLLTPFKLLGALLQSITLLRKLKPSVVLGMGGYASGPGGIAAWLLNIPLIVHEQNAVFGMTNRYLARLATYTLTGFDLSSLQDADNTKRLPVNVNYVGNPIRKGFFDIAPSHLTNSNQVSNNPQHTTTNNILIVGGSLGALALNQIVPRILLTLSRDFSISVMHQSGKNKYIQVQEAYQNMPNVEVIEFIDNMESAFSWADIIICRAGALTVAEVAGAGRVAIFVPLPIAVDDHQTANAKYLSDQGAAILIPQAQLDSALLSILNDLCHSAKRRQEMALKAKSCAHRNATTEVATFIEKAVKIKLTSKDNSNEKERRGQ